MADLKNETILVWNSDGKTGTESNEFLRFQTCVYSREEGLRRTCLRAATLGIRELHELSHAGENLEKIKNHVYSAVRVYGIGTDIGSCRPKFHEFLLRRLKQRIIDRITEELLKAATKAESLHASGHAYDQIDNSVFLAILGLKRSYKSECVICLSDNMMGTTCGCGHTEIVVFRPCGHSVCIDPCFYELCRSKCIELQGKTMETSDGKTFRYANESIKDVSSARNFVCPTCMQIVQSCFRAEDVMFSPVLFSHPYSDFSLDEFAQRLHFIYSYE